MKYQSTILAAKQAEAKIKIACLSLPEIEDKLTTPAYLRAITALRSKEDLRKYTSARSVRTSVKYFQRITPGGHNRGARRRPNKSALIPVLSRFDDRRRDVHLVFDAVE